MINPTELEIRIAAKKWYKQTDRDHQCLAENRLMRGEKP